MTILITNDDGLTDGLKILTQAALKIDKDSYAITPSMQKSAVAKGITLHKILRLTRLENEELPIYELNGTPADCTSFAIFSKEFRKPDIVLSGINIGSNLSLHAIYSSGTVGACLEASFYKIPTIAFSFEVHREERVKAVYSTWKKRDVLCKRVVEILKRVKDKIPPYTILNVNFPKNFENAEIVFSKPALIDYILKIEKRIDPSTVPYYWQYGEPGECKKQSDVYECYVNQCITITPLNIWSIEYDKLIKKLQE